jgi:alpha-amylase/alpha-mannosidase (GH57 family)
MLLLHMHQPFYKDLAEGTTSMPWVRLHTLKDYYGMVAILRDFPSIPVPFNLVPSLVVQLEDYASGAAHEQAYEIAFKPVEELTAEERESLLRVAFRVNRENLLNRYPRFRELHVKAEAADPPSAAAHLFASQDLRDLQVLSQLAWFDEIYLADDPEVRALVGKERGYSEADKSILRNKEREIFNVTLEEYRGASARGQIEI